MPEPTANSKRPIWFLSRPWRITTVVVAILAAWITWVFAPVKPRLVLEPGATQELIGITDDGESLVTLSEPRREDEGPYERTITSWDLNRGTRRSFVIQPRFRDGMALPLDEVHILPGSNLLAVRFSGEQRELDVLDFAGRSALAGSAHHTSIGSYSRQSRCVSLESYDGNAYVMQVFSLPLGKSLLECKAVRGNLRGMLRGTELSEDGRLFAWTGERYEQGVTEVWDVTTAQPILSRPHAAHGMAFSPDNSLLAMLVEDKHINRVDVIAVLSGRTIAKLEFPGYSTDLFFSGDARRLIARSRAGNVPEGATPWERLGDVMIWDLESGATLRRIHVPFDQTQLILPLGKDELRNKYSWSAAWNLILHEENGIYSILDLESNRKWDAGGAIPNTQEPYLFSSDGRLLITREYVAGSSVFDRLREYLPLAIQFHEDHLNLHIMDTQSGAPVATFSCSDLHTKRAEPLLSTDGRTFVLQSEDPEGPIEIWDVPPVKRWWVVVSAPVLALLAMLTIGWLLSYFRAVRRQPAVESVCK